MAILRGGVRIGGYDVRIGIPRDTSLDNVETDPRFRQNRNANKETTIGRFQSYINEAEGFARKARFYVEFNLPRSSGSTINPNTAPSRLNDKNADGDITIDKLNLSTSEMESLSAFKNQSDMISVHKANGRRVQAFCSAIAMPDRNIEVKEVRTFGPSHKIAFDRKSSDITATFMCDKFLRERTYFELWQSAIFSQDTNNYNFYDNYVSDVNIFQLGQFASRNERDDVTYAVKLFDVYPKIISAVEYNYENNAVQTFTVTFTFRNWINYIFSRKGDIELGSADFRGVDVKSQYGAFGNILNRLPPELRRAGVGVIDQLKRSIPIGGITGGRVFPPFGTLPPLNL